jgi:hypothetical protein
VIQGLWSALHMVTHRRSDACPPAARFPGAGRSRGPREGGCLPAGRAPRTTDSRGDVTCAPGQDRRHPSLSGGASNVQSGGHVPRAPRPTPAAGRSAVVGAGCCCSAAARWPCRTAGPRHAPAGAQQRRTGARHARQLRRRRLCRRELDAERARADALAQLWPPRSRAGSTTRWRA